MTYGKYIPDNTKPICQTFGCGTHLNLIEQRCGDKCFGCMNSKLVNVNLIINSGNKALSHLIKLSS